MSNEISRVYQFLSNQGDWAVKADKDGDGAITKDEFRTFMEDFEWNGEASDKNDLINEFWAKFDTNRAMTKISGTSKKDCNALNADELAVLEERIAMNDTLNNFTTTLSCPNVISGSSKAWKDDVVAELQVLLESYIAEGGTNENLLDYLKENSPVVENKVTAEYCAVEYLDEVMPELNKEYGYAFGSDNDLNELIKNYAQNLPEGVTPEDMKSTLVQIIDAYLATAGLVESNGVDLGQYGYNTDDNAPLNDLQESVAKSTLTKNLEAIKNDEYYEAFAETIDAAVVTFIDDTVANATAANFEAILSYGVEQFKQSEAYQEIKTTMDVKQVLIFNDNTSALYQAIADELGDKAAEILTDGVYYNSYSSIIDEAIEKANNGQFMTEGKLDTQALIEWVVGEVKDNYSKILSESGRADELSNEELYETFTKALENSDAMKFTDPKAALSQVKEAAITYCESLAARGEKHKELLADIFGTSNYNSIINSCKTPDEISEFIEEINSLVGNVKEIANVKVVDKSQNIINDINSTLTYNGTNVTQARTSLAFRVDKSGYVLFVGNNYNENRGVWNDAHDQALNDLINLQVRQKVQDQYWDEISRLGLTDSELDNLYNIAVFMTVSDTTVVRSMYDEMSIGTVIEEIVKNYSQMLSKVASDENARNYIKNVENKSLLNGTGTWAGQRADGAGNETTSDYNYWFKTLDKYYTNDSTYSSDTDGDDWVSIASRGEESFSCGGGSGSIMILTSADAGDNDPVNRAMRAILTDYVTSYSDVLEASKIIALFKEAQQTAFAKLEAVKDQVHADGASIYGYGESDGSSSTENYDTYRADGYYGVNSILINIMYEMERLISKEVMGM